MDSENDLNSPAPENVDGKTASTVSERKRIANQQNSTKSTGPKTARGKANSSRNAVKHGLLLKRLLFDQSGVPVNQELRTLQERLLEKYGSGDVRTDILAESLVVEYWRQHQALAVEQDLLKEANKQFSHPSARIMNLERYRTGSQRALWKLLKLLDEQPGLQAPAAEDQAATEAPATSAAEPKAATSAPVMAMPDEQTDIGAASETESSGAEDSEQAA
jgi:hypothetical protein